MIATSYVLSATVHLRRETRVEAIKEKPHFISQVAGGQGVEERAKGKTITTHHRGHRGHKETPHGSIRQGEREDRKSTRLNSSHSQISYAVFCLQKKKK